MKDETKLSKESIKDNILSARKSIESRPQWMKNISIMRSATLELRK